MTKEFIRLSITDEETLVIAFAVVIPPEKNLELYIDPRVDNTPSYGAQAFFSGFFPSSSAHNFDKGGMYREHFDAPL